MKVKFKDNTELEVIQVLGESIYFQGNNRDSLEFIIEKGTKTIEELDEMFSDLNKTEKITLSSGEEAYVHDGYILKQSISLAPVIIAPATSETQEVTEDRITVTMCQETYIERQLRRLGI